MISNKVVDIEGAKEVLHLFYAYARVMGKGEQVRPLQVLSKVKAGEAVLIVSYLDKVPCAYLMIEPDGDSAFVQQVYSIDPKCTKAIWKYGCDWAWKKGFENMSAITYRSPKGFSKYGMEVEGYLLRKELSNGRGIK